MGTYAADPLSALFGGRPQQAAGGSHLIDGRPAVAGRRVDAGRLALPACTVQPGDDLFGRRRLGQPDGTHRKQDFRLFDLGEGVARRREIVRTIQSQAMRQRRAGQRAKLPAEQRGGVGERADGVTDVELAIAKGALAVLPGLAPHDAGEADGQPRRFPARCRQRAAFERVVFRLVVM